MMDESAQDLINEFKDNKQLGPQLISEVWLQLRRQVGNSFNSDVWHQLNSVLWNTELRIMLKDRLLEGSYYD